MDEHREELSQILSDTMSGSNLLDLAKTICGYDGSFDEADIMDFEDAAMIAGSAIEFGRSIVYGNVTNIEDPVRYNTYGNLESVSLYALEQEFAGRTDELADWLLENGTDEVEDELTPEIIEFVALHKTFQ